MNVQMLLENLSKADGNLPKSPGFYVICIRSMEDLPDSMKPLEYRQYDGQSIIYTGTTKYLSTRHRNHFKGNAACSTVRKSLGTLMGYERVSREGQKYIFAKEGELTEWMASHLTMYCAATEANLEIIEYMMIDALNPPLNLNNNFNCTNIAFRKHLYFLRKQDREKFGY